VAELPTAPLSPTERDVIRLAATGQDIDRTFPQNCIGSGCHRHWFVIALLAPVEHAPLPARIVPLCISCSAAYPIARIQFSIFFCSTLVCGATMDTDVTREVAADLDAAIVITTPGPTEPRPLTSCCRVRADAATSALRLRFAAGVRVVGSEQCCCVTALHPERSRPAGSAASDGFGNGVGRRGGLGGPGGQKGVRCAAGRMSGITSRSGCRRLRLGS
jgi:hypothetical protein